MIAVIAERPPESATDDFRLVAVAPGGGSVNFTLDQVQEAEQYKETISAGIEVLRLLRQRRDKRIRRQQAKRRGPRS